MGGRGNSLGPAGTVSHRPNLGPDPARRRIRPTVDVLTDEATGSQVLLLAS